MLNQKYASVSFHALVTDYRTELARDGQSAVKAKKSISPTGYGRQSLSVDGTVAAGKGLGSLGSLGGSRADSDPTGWSLCIVMRRK